jgi:alpha-galactosidase
MDEGSGSVQADIVWGDDTLRLHIVVGHDGVARLVSLAGGPVGTGPSPGSLPPPGDGPGSLPPPGDGLHLVDLVLAGSGRAWSGRRYVESVAGQRLAYRGHHQSEDAEGKWRQLHIDLEDPVTGVRAEVVYRALVAQGVLRASVRLTNGGPEAVTVESVTSLLAPGLPGPGGEVADVDVMWADNDWLAEGRWQSRPFRAALPDMNRSAHAARSRACFGFTSVGTWSSGGYLPMGAAVNRRTGHAWAWQIEHNGAWHWQVGEHAGRDHGTGPDGKGSGSYLALLGPTEAEHQAALVLGPGEGFETVPVALAISRDGFEGAVAALTVYRRAVRRPHPDHDRLPVIFNDYMNTLMGDPTTEKLMPLITAAASVGAEIFCIDAGWYAEVGEDWWDTVGAWKPSTSRFPEGIAEVLDHVRALGMVPGLWVEPEVVGVRSPVAAQLPPEAFFQKHGRPVVEAGRYQLDLRHPAAVAHLDQAVDYIVDELGAGYLKFDYNINMAPGSENGGTSAGQGMLGHSRAFLGWADRLLDRHPGLVIENCSSGGMRTDYALLSRFQLQSTSDQQDFLRYPPIAAAAPAAIAPEQAAVWAYPQPAWSDDAIAFSLCNALLGRVHLSGHIDHMSLAQQDLVRQGISAYKQIRASVARSVAFWPLGLPAWDAPWVALGLRDATKVHIVVWHRPAGGDARPADGPGRPPKVVLPVPALRGKQAQATLVYPTGAGASLTWAATAGELTVSLPRAPSACLVELVPA